MNMLAMRPQTSADSCVISCGPGRIPCRISAASRIAVEAEPGMPSDSIGMAAPCEAELFAASAAATPSMAPLPNSLGRGAELALRQVGEKGGDRRARARHDPDEEPDEAAPDDRERHFFQSALVSHMSRSRVRIGLTDSIRSSEASTSAMPKTPMTTGMKSIPFMRMG
jgi:hypothetical protein